MLALAVALAIPSTTSVAQVDSLELLELREGTGVPAEVVAIYSLSLIHI